MVLSDSPWTANRRSRLEDERCPERHNSSCQIAATTAMVAEAAATDEHYGIQSVLVFTYVSSVCVERKF